MAPGCFSHQSANGKETMSDLKQAPIRAPPVKPITIAITCASRPPASLGKKLASSELFKPLYLLSPAEFKSKEMSMSSNPSNYSAASAATHYEIPLPLTPPPQRFNEHANCEKERQEAEKELNDESSGNKLGKIKSCHHSQCLLVVTCSTTKLSLSPSKSKPKTKREISLHSLISDYTVDSFEILEQTILKQKRLAKLKNTDLRKKVLLKRTFDLICDIMDTDNGFTEVDGEPSLATSNVVSQEESVLELELHDHSKMEEDEDEPIEQSASEMKLVELDPAKSLAEEEADSQVLPRKPKRRSCDDDEGEETFFCESDSSDQQLNYCRSQANAAPANELKIYSDDSNVASAKTTSMPHQHRNNHQRTKRMRVN